MAVFPPIDASTCANRDVGTKVSLIPLLKVAAIKPAKSVNAPPPIATIS